MSRFRIRLQYEERGFGARNLRGSLHLPVHFRLVVLQESDRVAHFAKVLVVESELLYLFVDGQRLVNAIRAPSKPPSNWRSPRQRQARPRGEARLLGRFLEVAHDFVVQCEIDVRSLIRWDTPAPTGVNLVRFLHFAGGKAVIGGLDVETFAFADAVAKFKGLA